ncbi:CvpA family protein [Lichenicoccus sp.]|uniref:CvpA family protein n=1 Tax=Lichenicoccus sp. TaxID=2781899 RepID=UPI003D0A86A0
MNWVDAVMLGFMALSVLVGLWRGLAREMLGLAAWIVAALLATRYYGRAVPLAGRLVEDGLIADVLAFAAVFVVILIGLSIAASLLSRLVRLSLLGGIDRGLGAAFGLVRGGALLVLAYILFAVALPGPNWPDPVRHAGALPYLNQGARYAIAQAPSGWRHVLPDIGSDAGSPADPSGRTKESF